MRPSRLLVFMLTLTFPTVVAAKADFPTAVPNGTIFVCATCHTSPAGGSTTDPSLNDFGGAVQATLDADGAPIWADVCGLDSDGDGATNGEELGDPGCTWQTGDANPSSTTTTNPGNASSAPSVPVQDDGGCGASPAPAPWIGLLALIGLAALCRRRVA